MFGVHPKNLTTYNARHVWIRTTRKNSLLQLGFFVAFCFPSSAGGQMCELFAPRSCFGGSFFSCPLAPRSTLPLCTFFFSVS